MNTVSPISLPRFSLAALLLGLTIGALGCGDLALSVGDLANPEVPESRGQMILFVGTDPATLTSDLYLAQAVDSGDPNRLKEAGPNIIDAEGFDISNLTGSLTSAMPRVAVEDLELFADGTSFPVPDRTGSLVVLLAIGRSGGPNEGSGRPYILDLAQLLFSEGPLLPGLSRVHFTWSGGFLILEQQVGENEKRAVVSLVPTLTPDAELLLPNFDPGLDVRFAGLERSSDRILLEVTDPDSGSFDVYRFDPNTDELVRLTEGVESGASDVRLSPDGSHLALTITDPISGLRSVFVFPLADGPEAGWRLGEAPDTECFWPVWQPILPEDPSLAPNLACVCQDAGGNRPDIVRWFTGSESPPDLLTAGPQPELFDGSMNGLTVRSRPQWDPAGRLLIFGASTQEDAIDGEALTLVALPLIAGTAYPIFTASVGSSGWAHFSSAVSRPHLLVWDRAETGLYDSQGSHPIQVVAADQPGQAPHPVVLGRDLFVSYPQYLGSNTMLYP